MTRGFSSAIQSPTAASEHQGSSDAPCRTRAPSPLASASAADVWLTRFGPGLPGSADPGQLLKGVERRRRSNGPFEVGRARTPVIRGEVLLRAEGQEDHVEEHDRRDAADIGADRGNGVPAGEGL